MSYEKIRIRKLQTGSKLSLMFREKHPLMNLVSDEDAAKLMKDEILSQKDEILSQNTIDSDISDETEDLQSLQLQSLANLSKAMSKSKIDEELLKTKVSDLKNRGVIKDVSVTLSEPESASNYSPVEYESTNRKEEQMRKATAAMSIVGNAANIAINQVDQATMGDKNFSASSQAIDAGVHGLSGMMMNSGNPYVMAAGVALEGLNFATKAGGRNVQGYDVNINNAGYGNLGHQESEAGRIWDKWSGATAQKLRRRNEQARMALAAQNISEEQNYQREARVNSVDNILRQNQIALAGGIDTGLLGN